jgi:hypothetical protein
VSADGAKVFHEQGAHRGVKEFLEVGSARHLREFADAFRDDGTHRDKAGIVQLRQSIPHNEDHGYLA